jgi:glycogen debranching enzyme
VSVRLAAGATAHLRACCAHDAEVDLGIVPRPRLADIGLEVRGRTSPWLRQSMADLDMLTRITAQGPMPVAGLPWFAAPFGRDALFAAWMTGWLQPALAEGVLRFLAAHQADEHDPERGAAPGKILHELRCSELNNAGVLPFGRSYSTADATPLFVMLLERAVARTTDDALLEELWPHARRALAWLDEECAAHPMGLLGYRGGAGIAHQGWKDSSDAIPCDASPVAVRMTTVELAGYAVAAQRAGAALARRLGDDEEADLRARRAREAEGALERLWDTELGTYVLAMDAHGEPCPVRSSNPGHLLFCGAVPKDRARAVRDALMAPTLRTRWGLRTLDAREDAYDPLSYHRGSVWPHDTCVAAMGLARYGFTGDAIRLAEGLTAAAAGFPRHRMPELFAGVEGADDSAPLPVPGACAPQAWVAAVPFGLLQACLGMSIDGSRRAIRLQRPRLWAGMDAVRIAAIPLRGAPAALTFERRQGSVSVNVASAEDVAVTWSG